ncbi:MAG: esterase [Flavobacteriaceae bacterium]|nr:esterase [Flavobacteriaceae bacterium]
MISSKEKEVNYLHSNSYSTLFEPNKATKNYWLACHGLGYLSKYFIRYFRFLEAEKNFVICPQAPSKYYQGSDFKYVGASWLTKENTLIETENVLRYLDEVYKNEAPIKEQRRIFMGYSQGVSVILRWMASRKVQCNDLLIHSGSIPKELNAEDFNYLNPTTKVHLIYGNKDEYINNEKLTHQINSAKNLFGERLKITEFDGNHQVSKDFIQSL